MANQGGGGGGQQEFVVTDRSTRVPVPTFSADNYKAYSEEVEMWREVCNVPKRRNRELCCGWLYQGATPVTSKS